MSGSYFCEALIQIQVHLHICDQRSTSSGMSSGLVADRL